MSILYKNAARLALGTAQFGSTYGIANSQGQIPSEAAKAIVSEAKRAGLDTLDTAILYGDSEKVLGETSLDGFSVITKLPSIPEGCSNISRWVASQVDGSLERLNLAAVDGLLLHRPDQLLGPNGKKIYSALADQRERGVVSRIGISIYSPDELGSFFGRWPFDIIQAPFSIMDTRLLEQGWFEKLESAGIQLHVRSIFLQGLLLMEAGSRPSKFNKWANHWNLWEQWLAKAELTPLQACLRYVLSFPNIERVVVGVDSLEHLVELIRASEGDCPRPPSNLCSRDPELLNPSLWEKL